MSQSLTSALDLKLHLKQHAALTSPATELLYGGAAGGGKSHLMRVASVLWASEIAGLQIYLFRRQRPDLIKNHVEGPNGYREMLAQWERDGLVKIVEDEIRFWNGSKIYLCHCKDEKDRFNYQGAEIHVLLIDELTHFTEKIYRYLRGRVRMVGIDLPAKYEGMFPRIIAGTNPGGRGHVWVKQAFVDFAAPMAVTKTPDIEGGMLRQYIPALLEDNPSMAENDPLYEARLAGLGSAELVRAMRHGDWDIVEGAFFDNWTPDLVVRPFEIPKHWTRFRSFDWGSARPFSCGWWAVASEPVQSSTGIIPRGAIIRYREWYGVKKDPVTGIVKPNVGLKMNAQLVAVGIKSREKDDKIAYGVADPAIFSEDGGPSIAKRMKEKRVNWKRADNARVARAGAMGGWDQMRARIDGEDGRPMIYCFDTCRDSIRTIPALMHDEARAEDLDTNAEDHAADEWRYACMSRPYEAPSPEDRAKPKDDYNTEDDELDDWRTA